MMTRNRTVAFALLLSICTGCSAGEPDPLPPDVDNHGERSVRDVAWEPLFQVGGADEDTVLQMPSMIAANDSGAVVIDVHGSRILSVSRQGSIRWRFGGPSSGGGPNEFRRPMDIALDEDGSAWVLDRDNARITVIDDRGRVRRRISLPSEIGNPTGLVPLSDGRSLLTTANQAQPLVLLDGRGGVEETRSFPWDGFADLHPLATQLLLGRDPDDGTLAIAFQLGDGLLVDPLSEAGPVRASFVEATDWPVVSVEGDETRRVSSVEEYTFSARSVSVDRGCLYVHFIGTSEDRTRTVDLYGPEGTYTASVLLPRTVSRLAVADGVVYAHYSDPFPTLVAWYGPELLETACG